MPVKKNLGRVSKWIDIFVPCTAVGQFLVHCMQKCAAASGHFEAITKSHPEIHNADF